MPAWVLAGLLGVLGSMILLVAGLLLELKDWQRRTSILIGGIGLFASVGWLALAAYVDANVQ
jgi:hypothetical protein